MPKPRSYEPYINESGLHAHTRFTRKERDARPHRVETIGERVTYRAVCECGRVFEKGNRDKVMQAITAHIESKT